MEFSIIFSHVTLGSPPTCSCETTTTENDKKAILSTAVGIMRCHSEHIENSIAYWKNRSNISAGISILGGMIFIGTGGITLALTAINSSWITIPSFFKKMIWIPNVVINPWISVACIVVGIAIFCIYRSQASKAMDNIIKLLDKREKTSVGWDKAEKYLIQKSDICTIKMDEVWEAYSIQFFKMTESRIRNKSKLEEADISKFFENNPLGQKIFEKLSTVRSLKDSNWINQAREIYKDYCQKDYEMKKNSLQTRVYELLFCIGDIIELFPKDPTSV